MEPHSTSIVKDAAEGIRVALSELKPSDVGSAEYAAWQTKRMALVAAHLQQAFASEGWASVYVGGGVLQFHLAGMGYQTADLDMVVARRTGTAVPRATLGHVIAPSPDPSPPAPIPVVHGAGAFSTYPSGGVAPIRFRTK